MAETSPEEFYKRLKEQLAETTVWPTDYLYKFIVLTDSDKYTRYSTTAVR
jgi:hypothetical protein